MNPADMAMAIEGLISREECAWLADQASRRRCIYEFGSFKGRSTMAMAAATAGMVYAVDEWPGSDKGGEIYPQFVRNMAPVAGRVIPMRMRTSEARQFSSDEPDMLFIDASHDFGNVYADIIKGFSLLGTRALICGHDHWNLWPDVEVAVKELCHGYSVAPGTSIWYKELAP